MSEIRANNFVSESGLNPVGFSSGIEIGPSTGIGLTVSIPGNIITAGIVTAASFVGDGSGLTGAGAALTGSTNNEVVTVTGANAMTGESGLTFDGTHLSITDGNLVIGTAGKGIDFSAQTATSATGASMSAELLDHYEEGSWTPVMKFGGGNTGMSATQNGTYTRIGRVVFFTALITLSDKGSSSGTVTVDGLPFNVWGSQITGSSLKAGVHIWFQDDMADIPNDQGSATGYIADGPTITFRYFDSNNNSGSNLTDSHLADTSSWRFSGQYFVA